MSHFWEMISLNLLPNKWVNPLPGVNDQHSVIKSVRGFCRCVEWEELSWQWDRDAGPRPAHLTSIVSVSVLSPTRVRASPRFLPLTFWLWFRLWCPPSLSSNKNKSRPGPASLGGGLTPAKTGLVWLRLRLRDSRLGRSLWHRIWMTTRPWLFIGMF